MNTVRVELGSRSYPITIGSGILPDIGRLLKELDFSGPLALVSNTTVFPLYGATVSRSLSACGFSCTEIILPDGEEFKTMASAEKICEAMLRARLDRTSVVVALGGGVIGDLAGFAASVYMRDIGLIVAYIRAGEMEVSTPDGDTLSIEFKAPGVIYGPDAAHRLNGPYTITSGTGIFDGASGNGHVYGLAITGGSITLNGSLVVPG